MRESKVSPFHDLVGKVPDREIAKKAGCSIATICHYRQARGIPSYRSTLSAPALEARRVSSAPPQQKQSLQGFAVVVGDQRLEYVVVAEGLEEAAYWAQKKAPGFVHEIRHLGPAIS
jgi:hypothetical protein